MRALVIGGGNIGRGFLGQLLSEGGYEIVFADVNPDLVDALNARGSYPLRLVDSAGTVRDLTIGPVRAINAGDVDAVAAEFARADVAATAVGANALPKIAPLLGAGIARRAKLGAGPIDVLLCENQWHAAALLRDAITPLLDGETNAYFAERVGLVETVIGRMVPRPSPETLAEDPLLIVAEPYHELPCARDGFKGVFPAIPSLTAVANFDAYEARKLYIHNGGHAALAYLGYPRHEYIWECVADDYVRGIAEAALAEAGAVLVAKYGFDAAAIRAFTNDLMRRFANKLLGDTVARVAADPLRKLRPDDRLIASTRLCLECGTEPTALARVIAAALRYDNPADPSAVEMQQRLREEGIASFLEEHCGLRIGSPEARLIESVWES
jgi:mannitol-1-phosphate 5-dehydrogenase